MKLEEIKPRSLRASGDTLHQLKVVGAHTKKTQNQVLSKLLEDELKRLQIKL